MEIMRVLVTTPYGLDSLQGNTVSAKRIVSLLHEAGLDSEVVSDGSSFADADVLIALHARKSAHFIDAFLHANPEGKVLLYLTGTDLYSDIPKGCVISDNSMKQADALVVSQEASFHSVPEKYQSKISVIYTSIQLPKHELYASDNGVSIFSCIGHLRAVKQPFMAVNALQLLDDEVQLKLLGDVVDEGLDKVAQDWQDKDHRFQWLGSLPHADTMQWMKNSLVTLNTSVMEGGANSVGESIVLGVPVLASRIEGNIGMLGADYDGYFSAEPADGVQELADLMQRVLHDKAFLKHLQRQAQERSTKFTRENEKLGWMNLIKGVE